MLTFSNLDKRHKMNKLDRIALMQADPHNAHSTTDFYTLSLRDIGDIMFNLVFGCRDKFRKGSTYVIN